LSFAAIEAVTVLTASTALAAMASAIMRYLFIIRPSQRQDV
jgi:hypothetical protein